MIRIIFALALLVGVGSARAQSYPYANPYPPMDITAEVISLQIRATAPGFGDVLAIGDSIKHQMPDSYSACGHNVETFALDGLKLHDVLPRINEIIAAAKPKVVVLALGKNDMAGLPFWVWQQDDFYVPLYIKQAGISPVLLTILPPERRAPQPWGDLSLLAAFNGYMVSNPAAAGSNVAAALGLHFVDFSNPPAGIAPIATDGGYLSPGFTTASDGLYIHPVGAAIGAIWPFYRAAVALGLSQIGLPCADTAPPVIPAF